MKFSRRETKTISLVMLIEEISFYFSQRKTNGNLRIKEVVNYLY